MPKYLFGLLTVFCASVLVSGCTTIASGLTAAPPDINKISFRECLLDRGFYSYDPLTGIALRDWKYRHSREFSARLNKNQKETKDRFALLQQPDSAFIVKAAERIADGVMPTQEYSDSRTTDRVPASSSAAGTSLSHYDDKELNHPYVAQGAPQRYPIPSNANGAKPAGGSSSPSIAYEEGVNWRLNRFLDCYVAPVGVTDAGEGLDDTAPNGLHEYGDDDLEGRLLRGHILLALLTQYGTELIVSHPSKRQVAQAELLLGHVKDAETSLRRASLVINEDTRAEVMAKAPTLLTLVYEKEDAIKPPAPAASPAKPPKVETLTIADLRGRVQVELGWKEYTTRVLRIFQVGVDIERIDTEQTLDRFSNLVAAFSGPIAGFKSILKDGMAGVVTVQKVKLYGGAYLRDARGTLTIARNTTNRSSSGWSYNVPALKQGWNLWDEEIIQACQVLATVAKKDPASATCIPATPAVKAAT